MSAVVNECLSSDSKDYVNIRYVVRDSSFSRKAFDLSWTSQSSQSINYKHQQDSQRFVNGRSWFCRDFLKFTKSWKSSLRWQTFCLEQKRVWLASTFQTVSGGDLSSLNNKKTSTRCHDYSQLFTSKTISRCVFCTLSDSNFVSIWLSFFVECH